MRDESGFRIFVAVWCGVVAAFVIVGLCSMSDTALAPPSLAAKAGRVMSEIFGVSFINSDGKTVYTRYVGEQHVKEDCNNYIPSAKEWINGLREDRRPIWMTKTLKIESD
jgi:hypothetical protein